MAKGRFDIRGSTLIPIMKIAQIFNADDTLLYTVISIVELEGGNYLTVYRKLSARAFLSYLYRGSNNHVLVIAFDKIFTITVL